MSDQKPDRQMHREWAEAETNYRRTYDVRYAALVIGKWPANPPEWAIEACRSFYEESEKAVKPILGPKRRGNPGYPSDADLLEKMADLICSGKTKHAAAKSVTGKDTKDPNIRRLIRLWDKEVKASPVDPEDGQPIHDRLDRAAYRRASDRGWLAPWDQPSTPLTKKR